MCRCYNAPADKYMPIEKFEWSPLNFVLAAAALLLLSACYPHTHEYVATPSLSGVLMRSGTPLAGASVLINHTRGDQGYCKGAVARTATDSSGRFELAAEVQKKHFASGLNPPQYVLQTSAVCFQTFGKIELGAVLIAPTDRRSAYDITCDWDPVGKESERSPLIDFRSSGICTLNKKPSL